MFIVLFGVWEGGWYLVSAITLRGSLVFFAHSHEMGVIIGSIAVITCLCKLLAGCSIPGRKHLSGLLVARKPGK